MRKLVLWASAGTILVLLCASLVWAQIGSPGFENCTGHLVPPSLPWYRPTGSTSVCATSATHSGTYAVGSVPAAGYNPVCQDIRSGAGTIDVSLWCVTSGNFNRSVTVALRAAGGEGADIDTADTGQCQQFPLGYNQHSVSLTAPTTGNYAICFGNGPGDTSVVVGMDDISVSVPALPTATPDPGTIGGDVEMSVAMRSAMGSSLGTIGVVGISLTAGTFLSKIFKRVFSL